MTAASLDTRSIELRSLGRHRLIAKLGQGGMANVYLTVVQGQHGVNKLFVAKVLLDDLAQDAEFVSMFAKEARVATLLHHRNLVQTFEVTETDGHHYITMEYLDGRPFHAVLGAVGREAMPLDVHVEILALALVGLHAAHEQRDLTGGALELVHRDVSPQNVFVTYDGEVKVVDFGVAKVRGGHVTDTGSLVGKIGYMAPEQALGGAVDRRADIFAVGIMLWEAIARRPFVERGEGQAAALQKRLNGDIPSPKTVVPEAPAELVAICERAIAYDADGRFATAEEFADALRAYLEKTGSRVGAKEIAQQIAPRFETERAQMRAMIEARLADIDSTPADLGVAGDASANGASRSRRIERSGGGSVGLIAGALVLAVALAFVGARFVAGPSPTTAATAKAPLSAALATTTAPAAPEHTTVRVRLRASPSTALLTLDGTPLDQNPFVGERPRDAATHTVVATADGFTPTQHELHLDTDVDVELALVPLAAAAGPAKAAGARRTAPSPAPPGPGARPSRPVDDNDPYAK